MAVLHVLGAVGIATLRKSRGSQRFQATQQGPQPTVAQSEARVSDEHLLTMTKLDKTIVKPLYQPVVYEIL